LEKRNGTKNGRAKDRMKKSVAAVARWYALVWKSYPRNPWFWFFTVVIFLLGTRSLEMRFLVWCMLFGVALPPLLFVIRYLENELMKEERGGSGNGKKRRKK
jgi:hypothetical protein